MFRGEFDQEAGTIRIVLEDEALDEISELIDIKGFLKECVGSSFHRQCIFSLHDAGGDDQDRNRQRLGIALESSRHFNTADSREIEIEQNQRRRMLFNQGQAMLSVVTLEHSKLSCDFKQLTD